MKVKVLKPFVDCLGEHKKGDVYEPHGPDLPGLLDGQMVESVGRAVERAIKDTGEKRDKETKTGKSKGTGKGKKGADANSEKGAEAKA